MFSGTSTRSVLVLGPIKKRNGLSEMHALLVNRWQRNKSLEPKITGNGANYKHLQVDSAGGFLYLGTVQGELWQHLLPSDPWDKHHQWTQLNTGESSEMTSFHKTPDNYLISTYLGSMGRSGVLKIHRKVQEDSTRFSFGQDSLSLVFEHSPSPKSSSFWTSAYGDNNLAIGADQRAIVIRDWRSGSHKTDALWTGSDVFSLAIEPLGGQNVVYAGCRNGSVRIFDLLQPSTFTLPARSKKQARSNALFPGIGHKNASVHCIRRVSDHYLVTGAMNGEICMWDTRFVKGSASDGQAKSVWDLRAFVKDQFSSTAFDINASETLLAADNIEQQVSLWSLSTGDRVRDLDVAGPVTCTLPQCVLTAAAIMQDMKKELDPCEDFSAYACGGFLERAEIPPDKESFGYFNIVKDQNDRVIRSIVDSGSTDASKLSIHDKFGESNMRKLQDLYKSCMDEDQIASLGRTPVVEEIQKLRELFPVNDDSSANALSAINQDGSETVGTSDSARSGTIDAVALTMTLASFNKIGMDSINAFGVSVDSKDPETYVLELDEGGLGLPSKEYYLDEKIMPIYEKTIGRMFDIMLGEEEEMAANTPLVKEQVPSEWAVVAKDVIAFETLLAAASTDVDDLNDSVKTYNPRTLEEIKTLTPSIDWNLLLQSVLPAGTNAPARIIVTSPTYQQNLEALLQKTSSKTLQNFFTWGVIRSLAGNLALQYRQPLRELNAALSGVSASVIPDRWKHCVAEINEQLGDMAGEPFVEQMFKGNSRYQVHDMIESLRSTYLETFPKLKWLDKTTAAGAVDKMKAIVQLIGFSTESPDVASSESVSEYYQGFQVDPKDYFGNQMRESLWNTERSFKKLGGPVNKLKMHMAPQTVNAYYSPTENQVVFPAGILQPPFFHMDNPEYINYGGIGVVAGHEITHGFDNRGHLFDANGRMMNWWSDATEEAFATKASCFVKQYGAFTVRGSDGKDYHVNGQLTLGENIADNGGLKQSFKTWHARYKADEQGETYMNYRLPGLDDLTPEQLFFISYARPWCSKQRPQSAIRQMRTDPHSPAKWRINGAVQNSVEFAEAFKCKKGSPMNPVQKCDLW
ncbi:hypothetical protein EC968_007402 [Mortierella alpina]|nr:hypothetical protein EC968_007402 [Mortierella alpina]